MTSPDQPLSILLIEDVALDAQRVREALEKDQSAPFHMEWLQSLEEGLAYLANHTVDVVLIGLELPDSHGVDPIRQVHHKAPQVPIVVLTGDTDETVGTQVVQEGAQDHLPKGYTWVYRKLLGRTILHAIERHRIWIELQRSEERARKLAAVATAVAENEKQRAAELAKACHDLEEAQEMLVQSEKLAAVGQMASGIAHEVKNPLGIILQGVDYLEPLVSSLGPEAAEVLHMIEDAVKRSDSIIRGLLDFSRPIRLELGSMAMDEVLHSSLELVQKQFQVKNIQIEYDVSQTLPLVRVDGNQLRQVFINMIMNSFQAMPNGGMLSIRAFLKELSQTGGKVGRRAADVFRCGQTVMVCELRDTGVGIPEHLLAKVFDPFVTTKPPGQGTGLGLTISRAIVERHGGLLTVASREGEGTTITVMLPLAAPEQPAHVAPSTPASSADSGSSSRRAE